MTPDLVMADRAGTASVSLPLPRSTMPEFYLVAGIVLAALTEAVASTTLAMARLDMIGDTYATPDEFARLEIGYIAAKLIAFMLTPWLMSRLSPQTSLRASTGIMTIVCGAAALTYDLNVLTALRLLQGAAGGVLLVSGQTLLFQTSPHRTQPVVRMLLCHRRGGRAGNDYALPTRLVTRQPVLDMDLPEHRARRPYRAGAFSLDDSGVDTRMPACDLDWPGLSLFTVAAFCLTYVLNRGSRWNWLDEPMITRLSLVGGISLVTFIVYQVRTGRADTLLDLSVFREAGFTFGFIASFVAGFVLFGSTYLIPSFAISVLAMTPTEAGLLLLPSSLMFIGTLLLTAYLVRWLRLPPIATVPFGIIGLVVAMCMLSGSNGESGFPDMTPAILLRGLALGFLFLPITLITLLDLRGAAIAYGVGLFNVGRLTGGLLSVAVLETLIDHQTKLNLTVLASHVVPGRVAVSERLTALTNSLAVHGMEMGEAGKAAIQMFGREITTQARIIAFDTAFLAIALFLIGAVPIVLTARAVIGRRHGRIIVA